MNGTPKTLQTLLIALLVVLALFIIVSQFGTLRSGGGDRSGGVGVEDVEVAPMPLTIYVDDTVSIPDEVRLAGISKLERQLPGLIEEHHFDQVKILHFGRKSWFGEPVIIPVPRIKELPCINKQDKGDVQVIKPFAEHDKKQAEEKCEEQHRAERNTYNLTYQDSLAKVRAALEDVQHENAPCTSFNDLLSRIALGSEPGLSIILSDAVDTCAPNTRNIPAAGSKSKVLLIMLPSRYDLAANQSTFERYRTREKKLKEAAPWLSVAPPNYDGIMDLIK